VTLPIAAVRRALAILSIAWAAIIAVAPMVPRAAVAVYALAAALCHQLPARSFALAGVTMPVCARCTGIYVGAAAAFAVLLARPAREGGRGAEGARAWVLLGLVTLPNLATLVFEWSTNVMPSNPVRAIVGLPLGAALAWVVYRVN
jgi:uncharacterized membrane protein